MKQPSPVVSRCTHSCLILGLFFKRHRQEYYRRLDTVRVQALESTGVLVETTGKKRDRIYVYQAYIDRLGAGTELGD